MITVPSKKNYVLVNKNHVKRTNVNDLTTSNVTVNKSKEARSIFIISVSRFFLLIKNLHLLFLFDVIFLLIQILRSSFIRIFPFGFEFSKFCFRQ